MIKQSRPVVFAGVVFVALFVGAWTGRADLDSGLVAYYPFSGNANDASGNGNNGTVYGPVLTNDVFGSSSSAYQFDGVNDYVSIPNSSTLSFTDNFSFSLWFNHSMLREQVLIAKSGDRTGIGIKCHTDGSIDIENGRCCPVHGFRAGVVNALEWHMITVSYGNGMIRAYLDGVFRSSETTAAFNLNPAMGNQPVYIGRRFRITHSSG